MYGPLVGGSPTVKPVHSSISCLFATLTTLCPLPDQENVTEPPGTTHTSAGSMPYSQTIKGPFVMGVIDDVVDNVVDCVFVGVVVGVVVIVVVVITVFLTHVSPSQAHSPLQ